MQTRGELKRRLRESGQWSRFVALREALKARGHSAPAARKVAARQVLSDCALPDSVFLAPWTEPGTAPDPVEVSARLRWLSQYMLGEVSFDSAPSSGTQALAHYAKEKDGRDTIVVFLALLTS